LVVLRGHPVASCLCYRESQFSFCVCQFSPVIGCRYGPVVDQGILWRCAFHWGSSAGVIVTCIPGPPATHRALTSSQRQSSVTTLNLCRASDTLLIMLSMSRSRLSGLVASISKTYLPAICPGFCWWICQPAASSQSLYSSDFRTPPLLVRAQIEFVDGGYGRLTEIVMRAPADAARSPGTQRGQSLPA
jgi:hypothetical protein